MTSYSHRMADKPAANDAEAQRLQGLRMANDLRHENTTFLSSSLSASVRRTIEHFSAKDAIGAADDGSTDPIELWGRRIGRAASLIGVIGLAVYLYFGYVR